MFDKIMLVSNVLFQPLAKWAGSSQKRAKQLRAGCVALYVFAQICAIISSYYYLRYALQSRLGYPITWLFRTIYSLKLISARFIAREAVNLVNLAADNNKNHLYR